MKKLLLFITAVVAFGSSCTMSEKPSTIHIIRRSDVTVNLINTRVIVTFDSSLHVSTYDSIVTRTYGLGDEEDQLIYKEHFITHN